MEDIVRRREGSKTPEKDRQRGDGTFEVFLQEAKGEPGEIAQTGDFIKLDLSEIPYPNSAEVFEEYGNTWQYEPLILPGSYALL